MKHKRRPFTPAQTTILLLTALLGVTWVVVLGLFVFTRPAPMPQATLPVSTTAPLSTPTLVAAVVETPVYLPLGCDAPGGPALEGMLQSADMVGMTVQAGAETLIFPLAGLQLPEDPALQAQALRAIQDYAAGKTVKVVFDDSERSAGYLLSGDVLINLELVKRGLARWDGRLPGGACALLLQQAQAQAAAAQVGLWLPTPVATRTFVPMVTLDPALQPCACSPRPLCTDFATQTQAQACYNWCNDYNTLLDDDRDGIACEALP